jgi:hypothetical protein
MTFRRGIKGNSYCFQGGWLLALAASCSTAAAADLSNPFILADNSEVLQTWQEKAAGGQAPDLVRQADGGTTIEWHGGVTLDKYVNSSSGGNLLTPTRSGNYYKAVVQSDLRGTSAEGDLSYMQLSITNTDDRSVLSSHPTQINSLLIGRAGKDYQVTLGDVVASYSQLGTNVGLRGVGGLKMFGQSMLSASAGVLAQSWESLANTVQRTQFLRNVYAAKAETQLNDAWRGYVTTQGYSDDKGSLGQGVSLLAPASARATTAGFAYQQGELGVQGEAGVSRWQEEGRQEHKDSALIVDANWRVQSVGLRAGHHKIGRYYSSLSGMAAPGIKETYVAGDWSAAPWVTLTADARHSVNEGALNTVNAQKTDALMVGALINFGADWPGWGLMLNHSQSKGKSGNKSASSKNEGNGVSLFYYGEAWSGSLGYTEQKVSSDAAPGANAKTTGWFGTVGRNWSDGSGVAGGGWTVSTNLTASLQEQHLNAGGSTRSTVLGLGISAQRAGWGSLNASLSDGTTTQTTGGADLHLRNYQVDAVYPFKGQNSLRFYIRNNQNGGGGVTTNYSDRTVGLQLVVYL